MQFQKTWLTKIFDRTTQKYAYCGIEAVKFGYSEKATKI